MKFRPLKESDIPDAGRIIRENYSPAYQRSATKEMLAMFEPGVIKPFYLAVEDKGKLIGFGGYMQSWMDYNIYTLFWINVHKDFWGRGVGTQIVNGLIQKIRHKKLTMVLLSTNKPNFYMRLGFKKLQYLKRDGYTLMGLVS